LNTFSNRRLVIYCTEHTGVYTVHLYLHCHMHLFRGCCRRLLAVIPMDARWRFVTQKLNISQRGRSFLYWSFYVVYLVIAYGMCNVVSLVAIEVRLTIKRSSADGSTHYGVTTRQVADAFMHCHRAIYFGTAVVHQLTPSDRLKA